MALVHYQNKYAMKTACGRTWKQASRKTERKDEVTCPMCKAALKRDFEANKDLGNYDIENDYVAGPHGLARLIHPKKEGAMKLTVDDLRRVIIEAVTFDPNTGLMGAPAELEHFISSMHPDDIADEDWVDSETGEVMLEKGRKARTSTLHPQYEKDRDERILKRQAERDAEIAALDAEDEEYEAQRLADNNRLIDEYRKAVEEFASNWTNFAAEMPDTSPEDAAPDAAEGFFSSYPNWKQWARAAGMSKADMKSVVQDYVYEAMLGKP